MIEGVDWNEVWTERMMQSITSSGGRDCASCWSNKREAGNYREMLEREDLGSIKPFREIMDLLSPFSVLDIGAGTGRLAIPFSRIASRVTVVEPSPQMLVVLKEEIKSLGIENVDCIQKRWEDVDVKRDLTGQYDLVVASFSLGFVDIRGAIEKMAAVSTKCICIMWFAGEPSWDADYKKMSSALFGKTGRQSMPKSDILFNVLYQMGVYPNINVFDFEMLHRFESLDEATDYFAEKFNATSSAQRLVLNEVLHQILEDRNGQWILPYRSTNMMFWWYNSNHKTLGGD
jgi:SAM-dependent methyltransferase